MITDFINSGPRKISFDFDEYFQARKLKNTLNLEPIFVRTDMEAPTLLHGLSVVDSVRPSIISFYGCHSRKYSCEIAME